MVAYFSQHRVLLSKALLFVFGFPLFFTLASTKALANSEPDFSGFVPSGYSQSVDSFSGDFRYSLPVFELPNGAYDPVKINLNYNSGIGHTEPASWVGHGWSFVPGVITRNVRGVPDDFKNKTITKYDKQYPNWYSEGAADVGMEYYSRKQREASKNNENTHGDSSGWSKPEGSFAAGVSSTVRYSNMNGYMRTYGLNVYGLGLNFSPLGTTYSFTPDIISYLGAARRATQAYKDKSYFKKTLSQNLIRNGSMLTQRLLSEFGGTGGQFSYARAHKYTCSPRFSQYSVKMGFGALMIPAAYVHIGVRLGISGSFGLSWQGGGQSSENTKIAYKANGYKHYKANGEKDQINDYYTEKGESFSKRDLYLGQPFANYDLFNVSAEGLSGAFRYHREKGGYFAPDEVSNIGINVASAFGLDVGIGGVGIGVDVGLPTSVNKVGPISSFNAPPYMQPDAMEKGFYRFNNDPAGKISQPMVHRTNIPTVSLNTNFPSLPGTKTVTTGFGQWSYPTNGEQKATEPDASGPSPKNRPEGTGVKSIKEFKEGDKIIGFRVVNEQGIIYYFTKPVYARDEISLGFNTGSKQGSAVNNIKDERAYVTALNNGTHTIDASRYRTLNAEINNNKWATSFLLDSVRGPDYVHLGNNRYGYYVNYTYEAVANDSKGYFRDRTPRAGLNYSHGTVSNRRDQNASFFSTNREVYYLSRIETSTHTAYFVRNKSQAYFSTTPIYKLCSTPEISCSNVYRFRRNPNKPECIISTNPDTISYYKTLPNYLKYFYHVDDAIAFLPLLDCKPDTTIDTIPSEDYSAFFRRGSGNIRLDNLGAPQINEIEDPAAYNYTYSLTDKQTEYLEKIVVFSKAKNRFDPGLKPDNVVRFEYDYSNCPGQPNSINLGNRNPLKGILTLKRLWVESGDMFKTRVSPYVFTYQHKPFSAYSDAARALYDSILPRSLPGVQNETPLLEEGGTDGWGYVSSYAALLRQNHLGAKYQGGRLERLSYGLTEADHLKPDPSAYLLKQIRLPSGGEMLIDYEEKDYQFVQNRRVMGLASVLQAMEGSPTGGYEDDPSYVINVEDLGLTAPSSSDTDPNSPANKALQEQIDIINNHFRNKGDAGQEMLYYKFLYAFQDNQPHPGDCQSEFIDGYSRPKSAPSGQTAELINHKGKKHILIRFDAPDIARPSVPRQACYDFYVTRKYRMGSGSDCIGEVEQVANWIDNQWQEKLVYGNAAERIGYHYAFLLPMAMWMIRNAAIPGWINIPATKNVGKVLNPDYSFIRLPMLKAKKGGGVRVKQVLYYDPGIENEAGTAMVYGKAYHYTSTEMLHDGSFRVISSGVAANEPNEMREENPWTTYLPKQDQSWLNRVMTGQNKDHGEGPVGESIMPGASVGHSRVFIQDINRQNHGLGYSCEEYLTYLQHPLDALYQDSTLSDFLRPTPGIAYSNLKDRTEKDGLVFGVGARASVVNMGFSYNMSKLWASQGFRFIQHDLHGKQSVSSSFSGAVPKWLTTKGNNITTSQLPGKLLSQEKKTYYGPGQYMPVADPITQEIQPDIPGVEQEFAFEGRRIEDNSLDIGVGFDLNFWLFPVNPTFSMALNVGINDNSLYTYSGTSVVRYPSYVKEVTRMADGVTATESYLAFDRYTGKPLVTVTEDAARKKMYQVQIPAYWRYAELGPKFWVNEADENSRQQRLEEIAETYSFYDFDPRDFSDPAHPKILAPESQLHNLIAAQAVRYSTEPVHAAKRAIVNRCENLTLFPSTTALRPISQYVYKSQVLDARYASEQGGLVPDNIRLFDHEEIEHNYESGSPWVMTDSTTFWYPGGIGLERSNALKHVQSHNIIPRAGVQKSTQVLAEFGENVFDDFEHALYGTSGITTEKTAHAHTGNYVANCNPDKPTLHRQPLLIPPNKAADYIVKFWLRNASGDTLPSTLSGGFQSDTDLLHFQPSGSGSESVVYKRIAVVEGWNLYEGVFTEAGSDPAARVGFFGLTVPAGQQYEADDFKAQVRTSEMNCHVMSGQKYKIEASFDENHFPTLYQYDEQERLIRKIKSTERGRFTIQETISNQPDVKRF